jgi:cystathionine gamma-synthase
MAALTAALLAAREPGKNHVVAVRPLYGGSDALLAGGLLGHEVTFTTPAGVKGAVRPDTCLVILETPGNPTLDLVDVEQAVRDAGGVPVLVDSTFMTPVLQRPLEHGAAIVMHSATKFLGGHADALGGVVCGDPERVGRIFHYREITGAALDPMAAFLLIRGMKTLPLRIARQNESALKIARWLEGHPAVAAVFYPGLETHPGHDIARRQMRGYGGVLSFMLKGGFEAVKRVLPQLRLARRAANLGAVETIAGPPATTSHCECSPEEREAMGIPEGLVRYSVGIEDADDLMADLGRALGSA